MQEAIMYRKGFSVPLLWYVAHDEIKHILKEVYKGGVHTGGKTLAKNIFCYGYFWPTINQDAVDYVR